MDRTACGYSEKSKASQGSHSSGITETDARYTWPISNFRDRYLAITIGWDTRPGLGASIAYSCIR